MSNERARGVGRTGGRMGGIFNVFTQRTSRRRSHRSRQDANRTELLETRQLLYGDTLLSATPISFTPNVESSLNGWIGDSADLPDVDIFSIDLQSGDRVAFDIDARADGGTSTLDSVLRVFNSTGAEVAVNDDGTDPDTGTSSLDSFVEFTAPSAGRYYVGVSGFSNFSYDPNVAGTGNGSSEGDYTLETLVTRQVSTGSDPGSTIATARTLSVAPGTTEVNGAIGSNADVDMFQITVQTGDTLTLDIDASEIGLSSLDSVLRVFDSSGTELLINDDANDPDSGTFSLDSAIEWSAGVGGTYFVGISSFPNTTYSPTTVTNASGGSTGDYRFRITIDRPVSTSDTGDTLASARAVSLTPGNTSELRDSIGNNSFRQNDVDIYSVQLQAGDTLTADVDSRELSLSTTLDSVLRVFNSAGVEIAVNDDGTDPDSGASGLDSALQIAVQTAGTYYVAVSSYSNFAYSPTQSNSGTGGSEGDYRLGLTVDRPVASTDAGDTLASARSVLVQPGQTTDTRETIGNNNFGSNDVDVFAIQLQAGDTVTADIDSREINLSSTLDSVLRFFDSSGNELAVNDDATDPDTGMSGLDSALEISVSSAGTYYVAVSSYSNFSYSPTSSNSGSGRSEGDYVLLVSLDRPVVSSDAGDTIAAARTVIVQPGMAAEEHESIGNNNFGSNDVDMYAVHLAAGDTLTADIDSQEIGISTSLDSILRVFDASGNEIAANDDGTDPDTGSQSLDSAVEVSVSSAGWYFVGVSSYSNFSYSPTQANSGTGNSDGDYRLVLNIDRPDTAVDAGDTIATAAGTLLQPGLATDLRDSIGNNAFGNNDVDVFAVQLRAGDTLTADIDSQEIGLSDSLDTILRVFSSNGTEIAVNDDSSDPDTGTFSLDSSLQVSVQAAGTYFVAVSSYSNFSYNPSQANSGTGGSQGDYRLMLTLDRPASVTDAGDTLSTAASTLVQPGQTTDLRDSIGNNSFGANDVDLFAIQLQAGDSLTADIDSQEIGLSSSLDTILRVLNASGAEVAVNDDATDPESGMSGLDSALEFTATTAGTYFVGVSSFSNFTYSPTQSNSGNGGSQGDYRLLLSLERAPASSTDAGDTIAAARPALVQAGRTTSLRETIGNNSFAGNDVDFYSVQLTAGQVVSVDIDSRENGLSTTLDSVVRVFNASGQQQAVNDDGVDPESQLRGVDSAVEFTAGATGTFYIGVSSFSNLNYSPTTANSGSGGSQGDYELNITVNSSTGTGGGGSASEPGNTLATARQLLLQSGGGVEVRENVSNSAAANSDVDLYRISLDAGDVLVADIDSREINLSSSLDSVLRLFDSAGNEIEVNDDGVDPETGASTLDSALEYSVRTAGVYYIGVSSYSNLTYNAVDGSGASGNSAGDYLLRLDRRHIVSAPTPAPTQRNEQVVWLNFEGGSATNGWSYAQNVPAFSLSGTGVATAQRQALIDRIVQFVRDDYDTSGSFENPNTPLQLPITVTTTRPASGQYMSVFIGGAQSGLLGIAEDVDTGNRTINDNARVFTDTIAQIIGSNRSFDQVAFAMADTISHEMGHNLGLSHSREDGRLMQTGALDVERTDNERFGEVETLYHTTGSQNSVNLLRTNLRTISSSDVTGGSSGNSINLLDSAGQTLVRSGVLEYTGDTDFYTIRANQGELLRLDLDARQFFGSGVTFSLQLFNPAGRQIAQSTFGIDSSGEVGDPFIQRTAPVTGEYSIRVSATFSRTATSTRAPYVLNVERLNASLQDSLPSGVGFVANNKTITVNSTQRSASFTDANGDRVTIQLAQGPGVVRTQLVGETRNNADPERIIISGTNATSRVSITVTQQGSGNGVSRTGDLIVTSRIGELVTSGLDIDRLSLQGPATTVTMNNSMIRQSISAGGAVTTFALTGTRGQVNGTAEFNGAINRLELNRISATGTVMTRAAVQNLVINQLSGGQITASQTITNLQFTGNSFGRVDASQSIGSITAGGNLGLTDGELAESTPTMIRATQNIGSVNITGTFVGAISAGGSLQNVTIGGTAAAIQGGRRVIRSADQTAPRADIVDITPDPRRTAVGAVTVNFTEAVSGVDRGDFRLTRNGAVVSLANAGFSQVSASRYTINLSGVSGATGNYVLTLVASGSGITDQAGNLLTTNASDGWRTDTVAPTADVVDVTPDPRTTPVGVVTINFSEDVQGVDKSDFRLTRNGTVVSLTNAVFRRVSGRQYTLDLSGVSGASGGYSLTLIASGSGIRDAAGNLLVQDAFDSWANSTGTSSDSSGAGDLAFISASDWMDLV